MAAQLPPLSIGKQEHETPRVTPKLAMPREGVGGAGICCPHLGRVEFGPLQGLEDAAPPPRGREHVGTRAAGVCRVRKCTLSHVWVSVVCLIIIFFSRV